jgi:hypothetical protein
MKERCRCKRHGQRCLLVYFYSAATSAVLLGCSTPDRHARVQTKEIHDAPLRARGENREKSLFGEYAYFALFFLPKDIIEVYYGSSQEDCCGYYPLWSFLYPPPAFPPSLDAIPFRESARLRLVLSTLDQGLLL